MTTSAILTQIPAAGTIDVHSDYGLRRLLADKRGSNWWDTPPGRNLLSEIRRRAVSNAAHIASRTDVTADRDLVDDVVTAAWLVLRNHQNKVISAARPWSYLMRSAQRDVLAEVRAQQLLTNPASIRGRAREVLPHAVRPVGATTVDLATAFRHEPGGNLDECRDTSTPCQVRRHEQPPLLEAGTPTLASSRLREPWLATFIDLLVKYGANRNVAIQAIGRISDLVGVTSTGRWEWAARRDPILARLGLSPDQCGALVALLAGSRKQRHNGKGDSLLHVVRLAIISRGVDVRLTPAQVRRLNTYGRNLRTP